MLGQVERSERPILDGGVETDCAKGKQVVHNFSTGHNVRDVGEIAREVRARFLGFCCVRKATWQTCSW
jgi:hypothetical protein